MIKILGIETSCDETAAAIVTQDKKILSNIIYSQIAEHTLYGGVVPEIAARQHLQAIKDVISRALESASVNLEEIDAIAVTSGPGLIGGVMVGVMTAKALAASLSKPLIAINHLEAHALVPRLTHTVDFPFLLMLMSGGHCQFILAKDLGKYEVLGKTLDDALGEAFDKVAQCLDLPYPGGPAIELLAREGNSSAYSLPRPLKGRPNCDLSFAGLKTAVRQISEKGKIQTLQDKRNLCAAFQEAVVDCLKDRLEQCLKKLPCSVQNVVLSGGVAANKFIRQHLSYVCESKGLNFIAPPIELCTDNGVMIAWAGMEKFQQGLTAPLDIKPRPRWPLEEL